MKLVITQIRLIKYKMAEFGFPPAVQRLTCCIRFVCKAESEETC